MIGRRGLIRLRRGGNLPTTRERPYAGIVYSDQQQPDRTLVVEGSGHESIALGVILTDDLDRFDLLIANKHIDIVKSERSRPRASDSDRCRAP